MKAFLSVTTALVLATATPALAFTTGQATGERTNNLCPLAVGESVEIPLSKWAWVVGKGAYTDQRCRELVPIRLLQPGEGLAQMRRELSDD